MGHEPSDAELNILVKLYEKTQMPLVASAILNLDEFITKN
jgi:hypothetical protein